MTSAAEDPEDEGDQLERIVDRVRGLIERTASPYLLDLRWMNGEPFIHLGGFQNHRSADEVVDLFRVIGSLAPGSYGLVHFHDDEYPGRENEFRVLCLVRGVVTEQTEPLLSPCIPTLEDPFEID